MILRGLALAVGTLVLFSGISPAQVTALNGTVKGEDGNPLKDAVIKIVRTDIKGNYKCKTNKKGEYYYGGLPLGNYNITVEVDGKDMDTLNNVRTTMGDPKSVPFDLQLRKRKQDALMKAAETGKLTQEQTRELSPEQKAALEKQAKERQLQLSKNKALNDAFNTGMLALQAKQYDAAAESFKAASLLDENQHVVWAHLADAYLGMATEKTGADKDALNNSGLEAWSKAIALLPGDAGYHNNYALALARSGKFPEAQAELEKAATLDPPNAGKYYFNLGALLVNSGKPEPAADAFKKAIELSPTYAEAHFQYGVCLMSKAATAADGKIVPPSGTKEEFETYLKLAPTGPSADAAKAMLDTMGSQIQTTYVNPNAPPPKKATKKK